MLSVLRGVNSHKSSDGANFWLTLAPRSGRKAAADQQAENRAIAVWVPDGQPSITRDRVLQIIVNLLSNAFRWTPEGGRIEVELSAENGSVSVAVADTGPGIDVEERERIFRPFWSRDGGGTTLTGMGHVLRSHRDQSCMSRYPPKIAPRPRAMAPK